MNQTLTMDHDAATRSGTEGSEVTLPVGQPQADPGRRRGMLRRTVDDTAYALSTVIAGCVV